MRSILPPLLLLLTSLLALPGNLQAAEVANLKSSFSSTLMTIEYDLIGNASEHESAVNITVEIKGINYSSNMLSMSGDFGRSITLGPHRQIVWHHLRDFPEGLDTVVNCRVDAVQHGRLPDEAAAPAEGFRASYHAVNRQTITETRSHLMWARNALVPAKLFRHKDALNYIGKLNRERFAGYNDWRLPSREDFDGLFYYGRKAGWGYEFGRYIADYLQTCGFTAVQPGSYWTATVDGSAGELAVVANTWNGGFRALDRSNYYQLWPVRNAP